MTIFPNFFLGNIIQENVFYDILERENAFPGYKNNKFKKSKNGHFSMVLIQKWPFSNFFSLGNIGQENVFYSILERIIAFYDILERLNAILGYKTRSSKSRKIDIFPKWLTHGFGPKMAIFQFFLGNICQENVFYDILERQERHSML